jgi:hypothetical protein
MKKTLSFLNRKTKATRRNKMKKRCYFVYNKDTHEGDSVVSSSCKEAKKTLWNAGEEYSLDLEWTEISVKWQKDVDISDVELGTIFEDVEGLKRGCYGWADDAVCPICKEFKYIQRHDDIKTQEKYVACWDCYEKEYEKQKEMEEE